MIKKILLLALVVVLAIGLLMNFLHGVNLPFELFGEKSTGSYTDLLELAKSLQDKKQELNDLNDKTFKAEVDRLEIMKGAFKNSKNEYDDLAAHASAEEIRQLNQSKEYLLDYIWMRVGTYAQDNDVKVLIDTETDKDIDRINFDVSGQYIAVINFIYDLQKDQELAFNIDNIVMQGGSSDSVTKASFYVLDVNVVSKESDGV
jgi:hypothetical protein